MNTRPMTGAERGYTEAQIIENLHSHTYKQGRCVRCDCRPGSLVSESACGDEPPRIEITDQWIQEQLR